MNEQSKNINLYSLEDIERYLQGKLSPAEMHELEKAAVQDPFLADAIEGYQATDLSLVKQDLATIHNKLSSGPAKVIPAVAKQSTWWRVAAAIILLAGAGIVGLQLFTGKNNTRELAKVERVAPSQKNIPGTDSTIIAKKERTVLFREKTSPLSNNQPLSSVKSSRSVDQPASRDKAALPPVAGLPAEQYVSSEMMKAKDTALFDKKNSWYMAAANAPARTSAGLLAQANGILERNMYSNKKTDPAATAKSENISSILANETFIVGYGKKNINRDTTHPDYNKILEVTRAAYPNTKEQAIGTISGLQNLAVAGNVRDSKRSSISFDTILLTDQKKIYGTFPDITATSSPVASQRFEVLVPKKDTESLSEIVVTSDRYDRFPKKNLGPSVGAAPANKTKNGTVSDLRGSSFMVNPVGGWYDFTKYLAGKIETKKDAGGHGTVEIKMDISESGKVSKIRILNSFNTQLNPILIRAIRKGPRWKSTDFLEKKDYVFTVDL
jgi:hypothetical protein